MMLLTLVSVASIAGQMATAGGQSQSGAPAVQVGIYGYRADGSVSGSASANPSAESTVYASGSLCQMGAGQQELPAMAGYAWRFSGKVLSISPEEAVVQLEWQRVLTQGNAATTPAGSVQLTLKAGDRVLLDSVLPESTSSCSMASAGFEARYAPRQSVGPNATNVRGGGASSGAGGGGGSGAGGGRGGARSSGGGGTAASGVTGSGGGGRVSAGFAGAGVEAAGAGLLNVDLWLVHTAPGRSEEVHHQVLRSSPEGAMFAFPTVTIGTSQGTAIVQVTGSFAVKEDAQGHSQLVFVTSRRITVTPADQRSQDTLGDSKGGSRTTNPMPGPAEVLSFELPPIRINGWPAIPDQFSVRVRITPR